jgi:hypothetical protein
VPGCPFVRWRSVHAKPPPATEEKACPPGALGPSEARKATSTSPALLVESGPAVIVAPAVV